MAHIDSKILREITYKMSRSSGPGGQHVNKVNTCVELCFNVKQSDFLTHYQKTVIQSIYQSRINKEGVLILSSQGTPSQIANKKIVNNRFLEMLNFALKPRKHRKQTLPTRSSQLKRLEKKRFLSEKKKRRKTNF